MMIRNIVMVSALAGATAFAGTAHAQFYWGPFGPRPPIVDDNYFRRPPGLIPAPHTDFEEAYNAGEITGILRDEGFRSIARPRRTGNAFVTTAIDPRGNRVRVVVDAYDGDIRSVTAVAPEQPAQPRIARTPDPSSVEITPARPLAPPVANPLNNPGGATQPKPQTDRQAARPSATDPKKPDRVILPNPATGNAGTPPPTITPAPQAAPSTAPAPAPQIAAPAVPPQPAPAIKSSEPVVSVPPVPAVPPPAESIPREPASNPATETLPLPPTGQ